MTILEILTDKISEAGFNVATLDEDCNLYHDIGLDSLSFILLILEIEEEFMIELQINEIEDCLNIGRFISLIENKMKECEICD